MQSQLYVNLNTSMAAELSSLECAHHILPTRVQSASWSICLSIPFKTNQLNDLHNDLHDTRKAIDSIQSSSWLGWKPLGFKPFLSIRIYPQSIRPQLEYGPRHRSTWKMHSLRICDKSLSCPSQQLNHSGMYYLPNHLSMRPLYSTAHYSNY